MNVPFLDLGVQHRPIRDEILAAWAGVLDATRFVGSLHVETFEQEFAKAHEAKHCVAVSSGTDALYIALRALGVGPGDRIVLPTNTFIATAEAVSMTGATPLLVDCDAVTKNINVEQAAAAMSQPGVRGVIGVHLYGQPADMDHLQAAISDEQWVMEDAAQAHLAEYKGRKVGTLSNAAAFSFYPGKNLGGPGEAGAIVTNDDELARASRILRDHGQTRKYQSDVVGLNGRMSELVGSTLAIKLPLLAGWTTQRRRVADRYRDLLSDEPRIALPIEPAWARSVYHLFVVHVRFRDRILQELTEASVGAGLHYPTPIHLQEAYAFLGHAPGDFPVAEESADTLLSLPMYAELTHDQIDFVAETLLGAVAELGESE